MARAASLAFSLCLWSYAALADSPGQPAKSGTPLQFEIVGNSLVSAQQMFVGTANKVYMIDKTEHNPAQVAGHPAWASEYALDSNQARTMDVYSNTFCAGGSYTGDGVFVNVGGNQGISWGGNAPAGSADAPVPYYGGDPYDDYDGGKAIRLLTPCDDASCNWIDDPSNYMTVRRWYPTVETLEDGSVIIIGGDQFGGYVNSANQNQPNYEFYPSRGDPIDLPLLESTLPANLFPLTWLLPSGKLFVQTNYGTEILDYKKNVEHPLADIPHAVRTYPASGASVMLPLTPANNYTATVLFCGGAALESDQWTTDWNIAANPADTTCVYMKPDVDAKWHDDAKLPEGRTMGNFILLPDGKIFLVNGGQLGTAGYGNESWAIGHSYSDSPALTPLMYDPDPNVPVAQKFSRDGLGASTVPRLYHSTAVLLPDSSVLIAGSNPNPDYTVGPNVKYPTEYRTEKFYPAYYNSRRPEPQGLLSQIGYGGPYFNISLTKDDLAGDAGNVNKTKAVIIRTGFSTHGINMGQRYVELPTSYSVNDDGSAVLHVGQLPPNPSILAPGPAFIHIVVNGVPSIGQMVMVGNGKIGKQPVSQTVSLPSNTVPTPSATPSGASGSGGKSGSKPNGAASIGARGVLAAAISVLAGAFCIL